MATITNIKPKKISADIQYPDLVLTLTLSDTTKVIFPEPYSVDFYRDIVDDVKITFGGQGYATSETVVTFDAPTGTPSTGAPVTAAGTSRIAGGIVKGVNISEPGAGYRAPPGVHFQAPAGAGAKQATGDAILASEPNQLSGSIVDQKSKKVFVAVDTLGDKIKPGDWIIVLTGETTILCDPNVRLQVVNADPDPD